MKIAMFSTKSHDRRFFGPLSESLGHTLKFLEPQLNEDTAVLAKGAQAVCAFVNDDLSRPVLKLLSEHGIQLIALRSAGFNNVDLEAAADMGIRVVRVPAYSPHAVAEHAVALMLVLNRKIQRAYTRVREGNLSLEGLLGFDMFGKTVGIVGTGKIGTAVARILSGFGCLVLGYDLDPNDEAKRIGVTYCPLEQMWACVDILTLHCPLTPDTHHLIDKNAIAQMKKGVMLINTSRGGLINTSDVIDALKAGQVGSLALDVYEEEENLFFEDLSSQVIQDDVFARLLTFPNVLVTGHQAFFTREAVTNIAQTTLKNISDFEHGKKLENEVHADTHTNRS